MPKAPSSHSKRLAALSARSWKLSLGCVVQPSPQRTVSHVQSQRAALNSPTHRPPQPRLNCVGFLLRRAGTRTTRRGGCRKLETSVIQRRLVPIPSRSLELSFGFIIYIYGATRVRRGPHLNHIRGTATNSPPTATTALRVLVRLQGLYGQPPWLWSHGQWRAAPSLTSPRLIPAARSRALDTTTPWPRGQLLVERNAAP